MLKKLFIAMAFASLMLLAGCGSKPASTGFDGTYSMVVTPELERLIQEKEAKVAEARQQAQKGDPRAKLEIEKLGGKTPDIAAIAKSIRLEIKPGGRFSMKVADPYSGMQTIEGKLVVSENKLTFQPEKINGREEKNESKLVALVMAWDAKTKQLTAESGSGPRLVLKKD